MKKLSLALTEYSPAFAKSSLKRVEETSASGWSYKCDHAARAE